MPSFFCNFPRKFHHKEENFNILVDRRGLSFPKRRQDGRAVGEEVYDKLRKQGLIEPVINDPSPLMNRCKMNPCIRYMLISLVQEAGFFYFNLKDETSPEVLRKCSFSSSRLHLLGGANSLPDRKLAKVEDISTVFNVNQEYLSLPPRFLEDLGVHHKNLKFPSLQGISRITTLPNSIVQQVNLEILNLRACHNLEKLPDIASLKKLTHLDASECYLIEGMPKGTEKLSSLRVLKGRGSAIWDPEFTLLKEFVSLRFLTISWGVTGELAKPLVHWNFPQELEKLELIAMPEEIKPELKKVKKLYIIGGKVARLDQLQQIDRSSVEILRLKHLKQLKIGNMEDVLKYFPRLEYFEKENCADDNMLWSKSRGILTVTRKGL
ncbi:hypothetical protein NL676_005170 [Syzygium grande]|nr:hypothetical protein NL676_005170 [Syzygium grande]